MKRQRYILEDVPEGQLGQIAKRVQGEWHGQWLDANTLFVQAVLDVHEYEALAAHPNCQVLSSPLDTTPAHQQATAFEEKRALKHGKSSLIKTGVPSYFSPAGVTESDAIGQAGFKLAKFYKNPHLEP